jgi:hypothetical protein
MGGEAMKALPADADADADADGAGGVPLAGGASEVGSALAVDGGELPAGVACVAGGGMRTGCASGARW